MDVKQAIGGQAQEGKPKPEMWVVMETDGKLTFKLRHIPAKIAKSFGSSEIASIEGKPDYDQLSQFLVKLTGEFDQLEMALIRPAEKTPFEDIIQLMDVFREKGIKDLGVTPL